jgi:hypothetical protein
VLALNGALPAAELCAAELSRLGGGRVEVSQHTRLHELGGLACPASVPGGVVVATEDDAETGYGVVRRVHGRRRRTGEPATRCQAHEGPDRAELLRRLQAGRLRFWVDETGQRVHLTGANPPSFGGGLRGSGVHAAGPARTRLGQQTRSPRSPGGSRRRVRGCACSPTKRTRPRTRSTSPSATGRWWIWPTSSSSAEAARIAAGPCIPRRRCMVIAATSPARRVALPPRRRC